MCSGINGNIYCNEVSGWCGNTQAHIDGSSGTYDTMSIPEECLHNVKQAECILFEKGNQ